MALTAGDQTALNTLKNEYFKKVSPSGGEERWDDDTREGALAADEHIETRIASIDVKKQNDLLWLIDKVQQYGDSTP